MATPNPAKPRCVDGCQTLLGNSSTGQTFCAVCGNPPADELAEAKRLLLKLFKANDACAGADPAVSQWPGSPTRTQIETFLGLKPLDPVEAQLQRDELLYGNSYALRNADGTMTRLDPTAIIIRQRKL